MENLSANLKHSNRFHRCLDSGRRAGTLILNSTRKFIGPATRLQDIRGLSLAYPPLYNGYTLIYICPPLAHNFWVTHSQGSFLPGNARSLNLHHFPALGESETAWLQTVLLTIHQPGGIKPHPSSKTCKRLLLGCVGLSFPQSPHHASWCCLFMVLIILLINVFLKRQSTLLTPLNLKSGTFLGAACQIKSSRAPLDTLRLHSLSIKESDALDKEGNFQTRNRAWRRPFSMWD